MLSGTEDSGYSSVRIEFLEFRNLVDLEPAWPASVEHLQQVHCVSKQEEFGARIYTG